ncbi:MAG: hypothetical protein AB1752_08795 [Candidatus Zixiibacteriota bacterium]
MLPPRLHVPDDTIRIHTDIYCSGNQPKLPSHGLLRIAKDRQGYPGVSQMGDEGVHAAAAIRYQNDLVGVMAERVDNSLYF